MRGLMSEFDTQLRHGSIEGSKWLDRKLEKAKAAADQAVISQKPREMGKICQLIK